MAASTFQRFTLLLFSFAFFVAVYAPRIGAQVDEVSGLKILTDALEWPLSTSMYSDLDGNDDVDDDDDDDDIDDGSSDSDEDRLLYLDGQEGENNRRSLFWRRVHHYISYGSLSANRIPCPPRSGRSYYTHKCFRRRIPVNPYTRGCSRITRCRR